MVDYDGMRGMHNYYGNAEPLYNEEGEHVGTDEDFPTEAELDAAHEDELTEAYGVLNVAGHMFDAGRALKELDPIAYRQSFLDWLGANYALLYDADDDETDYYERRG